MVGLIDGNLGTVSLLERFLGEEKSCTSEMTASWKKTHLPTILSRYELKDFFIRRFHQNQCTSKTNDVQEGNSVRYV